MQQSTVKSSRKKFLWWGTAAFAAVGTWKIFGGKKKKDPETIKMLTQDGRLVEIDRSLLAAGTKATDKDLQQWIKK